MALNWYLTLRNLCKTDAKAAELFQQLQTAGTDDEKNKAKQQAQEYIQTLQSQETTTTAPAEDVPVAENETVGEQIDDEVSDVVDNAPNEETEQAEPEDEEVKADLSMPAFTPRLAKCGITREEELFLHGVFVRKMSRDEKIAMRRSIYEKKTLRNAQKQAEYKAKRVAQREKDAKDPEKIKFHQERRVMFSLINAISEHKNLGWVFSNIDGLTPDIFREIIKKPANVNAIRQANPSFIDNFNKKYGE